jgi:hypothetical protein
MATSISRSIPLTEEDLAKAMGSLIKNLQPVLYSIKQTLGGEWTFYEECIREIIMGFEDQNCISVWVETMNALVDGRPAILSDHLGVVFLFGNMGIDISPQAAVTGKVGYKEVKEELRDEKRKGNRGEEVEEALLVVERKAVEAAVRDIQEQEIVLDGYK